MTNYEYAPASALRPGDTVILNEGEDPLVLTQVRVTIPPEGGGIATVSLYREPTDDEYASHLEEHDQDLRATWVSTIVGWFPVLRAVPPQTGNLAY